MRSQAPHHKGFTIVELITVMVVLAILSIGTMRFISDSTEGFFSASDRAEVSADVRLTLNRLNRELREALPNSIRVSGDCLEFIPVVSATVYVSAPIGFSASNLTLIPLHTPPAAASHRLAVAPGTNVYQLSANSDISPTFTLAAPDAANEVIATLASPHQFSNNSPQRRVYVVDTPVSFCVDRGSLWRYQSYGFQNTQPTAATLPTTMPGRALLVEELDQTVTPFSISPATLTRNAVISVVMHFQRGGDTLEISHNVQVRNII
ncbi:MAG: type II secretion system protein [Pseudomonadota bacterium]